MEYSSEEWTSVATERSAAVTTRRKQKEKARVHPCHIRANVPACLPRAKFPAARRTKERVEILLPCLARAKVPAARLPRVKVHPCRTKRNGWNDEKNDDDGQRILDTRLNVGASKEEKPASSNANSWRAQISSKMSLCLFDLHCMLS